MSEALVSIIIRIAEIGGGLGGGAGITLIGATLLFVVVADRRLLLALLAACYLTGSLLLAHVLDPRLVFVKLVAGLFVVLIMLTTERFNAQPEQSADSRQVALRVAMGGGALAVSWLVQQAIGDVAYVTDVLQTPIVVLIVAGSWLAIVGRGPFKAGGALLLFLIGFDLYYAHLEQSLFMTGAMIGAHFLVALSTAYVTTGRSVASVVQPT